VYAKWLPSDRGMEADQKRAPGTLLHSSCVGIWSPLNSAGWLRPKIYSSCLVATRAIPGMVKRIRRFLLLEGRIGACLLVNQHLNQCSDYSVALEDLVADTPDSAGHVPISAGGTG